MIKIETEKVMILGGKYRKLISITGVEAAILWGNKYTDNYPYLDLDVVRKSILWIGDNVYFRFEPGKAIAENDYFILLSQVKAASNRAHSIEKNEWSGIETDEI